MLATMSETDAAPLNWSEVGVSELVPTGTVTLLLADVEGSTRLLETQPEEMTAAFANLDRVLTQLVDAHHGVQPVQRGEGESFVIAFGRASDAVACALELQLAPLAPIRLRIGVHTGEVQRRDEANFVGPTINRTARLRDLAHGGQTVLSDTTGDLARERLPDGAWLTDLGIHPVRDLPRPEHVMQLCHLELRNKFPPLRAIKAVRSHNLPAQLTSFVGRQAQIAEVRRIVVDNRLVTLTGAGGAGKTRLALEVAAQLAGDFPHGVWYVDLAPIANPAVVPVTVARTVGLPDQPGRSTMDILLRFVGDRRMLLLLDNCEHLLDVCGQMIVELVNVCAELTILATSREALGLAGEVIMRVPSLSVADEAIELFSDRARRVRPDFTVGHHNSSLVEEICRRLDGMPLAIELAAARVRALSLPQIVDSLHDRFRLLTGGARTAVRRQQTLRASVDWSHALLTEPERILFRRLAVFMGGFDLDAAQAVGASSEVERYQLLDVLTLLFDKSLVVAEDSGGAMRYRLLETVRQYALEKLGESGEADDVRSRHCDHYTAGATMLDLQGQSGFERLMLWAEVELDNLRAAFAWSRENADAETALGLVSSLHLFWISAARFREGLAGFDAVLTGKPQSDVAPAVWVRAVADEAILAAWAVVPVSLERAQEALATAREIGDADLLARILMACGTLTWYFADVAQPFFGEAIDLLREAGDRWQLCRVLTYQALAAWLAGEPSASCEAAEEALALAEALADPFLSRGCREWLGSALGLQGNLTDSALVLRAVVDEAKAAQDRAAHVLCLTGLGFMLAFQGHPAAAYSAAESAQEAAEAVGGLYLDAVHTGFAYAALAAGDPAAAREASETAWRHTVPHREIWTRSVLPLAQAELACGDLAAARRWLDDTVAIVPGWYRMLALTTRAFVAIAQGEPDQADRDAHDALEITARTKGYLHVPDTLECLGRLAADGSNRPYAARLLGAAEAIRRRTGEARFPMYQASYDAAVTAVRNTSGQEAFDGAWAEGVALSTEEAIAYAQRGRGERKRPSTGWESLTPTERDVVRLVCEGLGNKDIAARFFISPRTVQTHLTHVYTKLGLTSRVQLSREAARHT